MFKVGDQVAYGLHGKCEITGISTKEMGDTTVEFYQVRQIKNPIAAKIVNPNEPAILIPVSSATNKGLRALMSKEQAEEILALLSSADWHFEMNETWISKQKKLEECIRKEGYTGLAKVVGHLHVQLKRETVPTSAVQKFYDSVERIFAKELAEALGLPAAKDAELLIARALKNKVAANN